MTGQDRWKTWLEANAASLLLYARQQTRCEADAEDVLQAAIIKTWRQLNDPGSNAAPIATDDLESHRGRFFANIRRCAIDLGRGQERRRRRDDAFAVDPSVASQRASWFEMPADDSSCQLQIALASIPDIYREVITLKIWGELTFAQIAENLGISPNTAASRYRYGLETLRARLSESPTGSRPRGHHGG